MRICKECQGFTHLSIRMTITMTGWVIRAEARALRVHANERLGSAQMAVELPALACHRRVRFRHGRVHHNVSVLCGTLKQALLESA